MAGIKVEKEYKDAVINRSAEDTVRVAKQMAAMSDFVRDSIRVLAASAQAGLLDNDWLPNITYNDGTLLPEIICKDLLDTAELPRQLRQYNEETRFINRISSTGCTPAQKLQTQSRAFAYAINCLTASVRSTTFVMPDQELRRPHAPVRRMFDDCMYASSALHGMRGLFELLMFELTGEYQSEEPRRSGDDASVVLAIDNIVYIEQALADAYSTLGCLALRLSADSGLDLIKTLRVALLEFDTPKETVKMGVNDTHTALNKQLEGRRDFLSSSFPHYLNIDALVNDISIWPREALQKYCVHFGMKRLEATRSKNVSLMGHAVQWERSLYMTGVAGEDGVS